MHQRGSQFNRLAPRALHSPLLGQRAQEASWEESIRGWEKRRRKAQDKTWQEGMALRQGPGPWRVTSGRFCTVQFGEQTRVPGKAKGRGGEKLGMLHPPPSGPSDARVWARVGGRDSLGPCGPLAQCEEPNPAPSGVLDPSYPDPTSSMKSIGVSGAEEGRVLGSLPPCFRRW